MDVLLILGNNLWMMVRRVQAEYTELTWTWCVLRCLEMNQQSIRVEVCLYLSTGLGIDLKTHDEY